MTTAAMWVCVVASGLMAARALAGPTLADRVVAVDAALATLAATMVIVAVREDDPTRLKPAVVVVFVGFVGTSVIAQVTRRRAR